MAFLQVIKEIDEESDMLELASVEVGSSTMETPSI